MIQTCSFRKFSALLIGMAVGAQAQTGFGNVDLPATLAAPGTVVEGALNRSPVSNNYLGWCDGPLGASDGAAYVACSDDGGVLWKVPPVGKAVKYAAGMYQGSEFDLQGKILALNVTTGIRRFNDDGTFTTLETFRVKDLSQSADGSMFLCDHGATLYYRTAAGVVTKIPGNGNTTGIKWVVDKKILYVSDGNVYRYNVADNGAISGKTQFAAFTNTDGLEVDENYNVYVTNWKDGAIHVFSPDGKLLGKMPVKSPHTPNGSSNVTNLAWGGTEHKTLYITGDGGLYKVQMKVAGWKQGGSVGVKRSRIQPRATANRALDFADRLSLDGRTTGPGPAAFGRYLLSGWGTP